MGIIKCDRGQMQVVHPGCRTLNPGAKRESIEVLGTWPQKWVASNNSIMSKKSPSAPFRPMSRVSAERKKRNRTETNRTGRMLAIWSGFYMCHKPQSYLAYGQLDYDYESCLYYVVRIIPSIEGYGSITMNGYVSFFILKDNV